MVQRQSLITLLNFKSILYCNNPEFDHPYRTSKLPVSLSVQEIATKPMH